jgi:hypothetical protein
MQNKDLEKLKYPIGHFVPSAPISSNEISEWIDDIRVLPEKMRNHITSLDDTELSYLHRPEGWTVRQIVHHVADSHMNSFIRFKWTLTEDNPTIKTYFQEAWSGLPDASIADINMSLDLLQSLHARWCVLLDSLSPADLRRTLFHPEMNRTLDLRFMVGLYAWHGKHHVEHIKNALQFEITN